MTVWKLVSPWVQLPSSWRVRGVTARRRLATSRPVGVERSSGSAVRLPTRVTRSVSDMTVLLGTRGPAEPWCWWLVAVVVRTGGCGGVTSSGVVGGVVEQDRLVAALLGHPAAELLQLGLLAGRGGVGGASQPGPLRRPQLGVGVHDAVQQLVHGLVQGVQLVIDRHGWPPCLLVGCCSSPTRGDRWLRPIPAAEGSREGRRPSEHS